MKKPKPRPIPKPRHPDSMQTHGKSAYWSKHAPKPANPAPMPKHCPTCGKTIPHRNEQ
jgi:hypothetical protein